MTQQVPPSAVPQACVIGQPIAQSRSPLLHGYWLRRLGLPGGYDRREVSPEGLGAFFAGMSAEGLVGCNVTVPHKTAVIPYLARLDDAAAAIGAVNTIWREDGALVGGNTDAHGFIANLDDRAPGWGVHARRAVVLGAGGAARAAVFALLARGLAVDVVNRTIDHARDLAAHFGPRVAAHGWDDLPGLLPEGDLLVNTTSLGMTGKPPLEIDLTPLKLTATVYDIVYVPLTTPLLAQAAARGHRVVDGLGMLLHQAVPGFRHWFGATPEVTAELRALIEDDILGRSAETPQPS
jgi:shikimate dehydrogenase